MGRTAEFNTDDVVDAATLVFWQFGYAQTSIRDLLTAMNLGESSFYHSFGSKQKLFLRCLEHYNTKISASRLALLSSQTSIKKGLRIFFAHILDELDDPKIPNLCLMAASLSPDILAVAKLNQYLIMEMKNFEDFIAHQLSVAVQKHELPPSFDARVTSQLIVTFLQGLFRVIHVLNTKEEMAKQIDSLLDGLGV